MKEKRKSTKLCNYITLFTVIFKVRVRKNTFYRQNRGISIEQYF